MDDLKKSTNWSFKTAVVYQQAEIFGLNLVQALEFGK